MVTTEEKKNLRRAVLYGGVSVILIVLFIFVGIPSLAKISTFVVDFKKSSQPIDKNDTTPPGPPKFNTLPEFTNKANLEIKGRTEPSATIKLFLNDNEEQVTADNSGNFTFTMSLAKGKNTISAMAKDQGGNEGNSSDKYVIYFDDTPPELEVSSPQDGASFYGSLQRQVVIEGKTEEGSKVTINDRFVVVDDSGKFSFATTLSEGDNNFNVRSADRAGNEITKGITLHFWK